MLQELPGGEGENRDKEVADLTPRGQLSKSNWPRTAFPTFFLMALIELVFGSLEGNCSPRPPLFKSRTPRPQPHSIFFITVHQERYLLYSVTMLASYQYFKKREIPGSNGSYQMLTFHILLQFCARHLKSDKCCSGSRQQGLRLEGKRS